MSLGLERVRHQFNPGGNPLVEQIKQDAAHLIDFCNKHRDGKGSEEARLWSLAMTAIEEGAMWAVKAATSGHEHGAKTEQGPKS